MRVLVVEDDKALGVFLQKGLALAGHQVEWAGDGEAALASASTRQPDLMVLDLGLPRVDGTEVLVRVRAKYADTSILVLTGRSGIEECVRCLNSGADDYVLKPFSFQELMARCTGIQRRREQHSSAALRHGELEIDRMSHSVRRSGQEIELTAKEYALLEFMMLRRGECCTRAELLREVWHLSPDTATNIVDVYVNYLRRKLAAAHPDGALSAPVIETVRGAGYRLCGAPIPVAAAMFCRPHDEAARA